MSRAVKLFCNEFKSKVALDPELWQMEIDDSTRETKNYYLNNSGREVYRSISGFCIFIIQCRL